MLPIKVALTVSVILVASFLHPGQAEEEIGYCPCNFNFSFPLEDKGKPFDPKAPDADLSCYGSVPLIAGIKNIEEDDSLKDQLRKQNFTLNKVLEYSCYYYGAYPLMFAKEDDPKTKLKALADLHPTMKVYRSLFFIGDKVGAEVGSTAYPTHFFECGSLWNSTANVVQGNCNDLVAQNRLIVRGLCLAAPVDKTKELEGDKGGGCYCPCTFHPDDSYHCTRDVVRCMHINNTDDMIATCSTAGMPAIVARANNESDVLSHWIADALFFIGVSTNNFTVDDSVGCGYKSSKDNNDVISNFDFVDQNDTPLTCNQFLEEKLLADDRFFAVLCTTTLVNTTVRGDCGKVPEDENDLDEEDCGTVALFDPQMQPLVISVIMMANFYLLGGN